MSSPVGPVVPVLPPPLPPVPAPLEGTFAERLDALAPSPPVPPAAPQVEPAPAVEEPSAVVRFFTDIEKGLQADGARVEAVMEAARSGKDVSNAELLAMQAAMYRWSLTLDLTSKLVNAAVDGLKTLLKMQV